MARRAVVRSNAGHCRPKITEAIQRQAAELDYAPLSRWATRGLRAGEPDHRHRAKGIEHVFYTNSLESVETALKLAIAYHRRGARGAHAADRARAWLSRGVNFGGISVGGIVNNRKVSARCWAVSITCRTPICPRRTPIPR